MNKSMTVENPMKPANDEPGRGEKKSLMIDILVLLVLFLFFFLLQAYWLFLDPMIPGGDAGMLLVMSLKFNRFLAEPGGISSAFFSTAEYPPLPFFLSTVLYRIFGEGEMVAYLGISLTVLLSIFGIYFAGRKVGGRSAGILSVLLLLSCPEFLYESKSFLPDVPMMGFLALALAALLYSDGFRKKNMVLSLGIIFGLGMLAKFTMWYFLLGAILVMLPDIIGKEKRDLKILVLISLAGLIVFVSWLFKNQALSDFFQRFIIIIWPLFFLLGLLIFRVLTGKTPETSFNNFLATFFLSAGIFVPWYLGAACDFFEKTRIHFSDGIPRRGHLFSMFSG
ncbi:MAG: glycosyltransferase family 39 protein [Candidatus Eremiobacteraeota bacterium]|nr:glycosyltransferase family 39 protein [Candidatus Eremiobacteraeota bacterium]